MSDIISEEDILAALLVVDGSDRRGHAVARHHLTGDIGGLFDVLGSAGRNIIKDKFLCDPAAQADHDLLQHTAAGVIHLVAVGQGHGITARSVSGGDHGNGIDITDIRQFMEENGMACLVISCNAFFLLGNHMALFLRADADLDKSIFDICLCKEGTIRLRRRNGSFIEQVFQIRAGEAGRSACDLLQIHIVAQGLVGGVDLQDFLPALYIGASHRDLAVKAARPQDRGVEDVDPVGRRHDDDSFIDAEAVHFHQQLVEGLFAFVVGTSQTCTSAARDRVDLIYEYDAGGILLCLFKHVTDAGCADTDKHLYKIGARNAEKRHLSLSGNSSCQKGLTCAGSTLQKDSLGDTRTDFGVFGGIAKEIDDLLQI